MRKVAGPLLLLSLAACSKTEPPAAARPPEPAAPVVASAPAANAPRRESGPGVQAPSAQSPATPAEVPAPDGAAIFAATCATCHMPDGSGVPFLQPSIQGSAWISNPDPQLLLSLILRGSAVLGEGAQAYENDMAPQEHLNDAEIAAVATYVRGRFATPPVAKPVSPAEAALARARPGLPE